MNFFDALWPPGSVASGLATLSLAVTFGMALGAIRVRGVRLGISGVLFTALLFGQFGQTPSEQVLSFLGDFSLIVFVYTIGLQVGPSFVDSLKAEGLRLNLLSVAVLVLGAAMTEAVVALCHYSRGASPGLYAGAFTTTPGLGAAQEALRHLVGSGGDQFAGLAYAVTYPFGMIGPVFAVAIFRRMFKVDIAAERDALGAAMLARRPQWAFVDIEITNKDFEGTPLKELNLARRHNIFFSRVLHNGVSAVPFAETQLHVGDIFRAIGLKPHLDDLVILLGHKSETDLSAVSDALARADLLVTSVGVTGKSLRELNLVKTHGVALTRVTRAGVNLLPTANLTLHFGDLITAVGPPAGLKAVEQELGNCPEVLNHSHVGPIFLGIVLGVLVGSIPLAIPGLKGSIKLGLASGPMLVAIGLSRLGNVGSVVWYMPSNANQLFRDFGLAVFLACVGLQQGDHFVQKLFSGPGGLELVVWGVVITMVPLLLVGIFARRYFKMNFITLAGWAAGAMTSSPALLYADEITQSEACAQAYAAVAPLALIVPIICCQILATLG
ncbi:MAG: putative transporter [Tepidisphaeraceae bacterium]|jgi:putative transport protein